MVVLFIFFFLSVLSSIFLIFIKFTIHTMNITIISGILNRLIALTIALIVVSGPGDGTQYISCGDGTQYNFWFMSNLSPHVGHVSNHKTFDENEMIDIHNVAKPNFIL